MFGMGAGELILVLVIALLIFGPKKLPDLAKGIGKALREFRRASSDLQDQLSVDHELGDAVREVQAAASGAPSPAELAAARRAYDAEHAPTVAAAAPAATRPGAGTAAEAVAESEDAALDAIKAGAAAKLAAEAQVEVASSKPPIAPAPDLAPAPELEPRPAIAPAPAPAAAAPATPPAKT